MNDLNYLKDNIMSRRWKTKYEQCSQAVRDKLDKLDEMYINGKRTISSTLTNICRSHG